jgi:hypothetical protein
MPKLEITEPQKEDEKAWDSYIHNSNIPPFTTNSAGETWWGRHTSTNQFI